MKVFISATSNGLQSYREGVARVLRALGEMPEEEGEFHASYHELALFLKGRIAACQAVICLVGSAYGHEPPGQPLDEPPRSHSQLEYLFARELRLPVYVLDARGCDLDALYQPEAERERRLQERFWEHLEATDDRLRSELKSQGDLDLRIIEIWRDWHHQPVPRADQLPTPVARLHAAVATADGGRLRSCLARLTALAACLAVVEARSSAAALPSTWSVEQLGDGIELLHALYPRIESPFVPELWRDGPPLDRALLGEADARVDELPFDAAQRLGVAWRAAFGGLLKRLAVLSDYLFVRVDFPAGMPRLRLYRGLDPDGALAVEWSQDRPAHLPAGSIFLLSLARQEALCLSPVVRSAAEEAKVLCGLSARQRLALPLGLDGDPGPARLVWGKASGWRGKLLAPSSWRELSRRFPAPATAGCERCGDWCVLGPPYERGRFLHLHYTRREGDLETAPVMLYWARADLAGGARRRLAERFAIWRRLGADPEARSLVLPVLDAAVSAGDAGRPYLVTASASGYRPLSETLARAGTLEPAQLVATMKAALHMSRLAGSNGVRLLAFNPRHILVDEAGEHRFAAFGSAVPEHAVLPGDPDLRQLHSHADDLAPELRAGASAGATSDIFALGVLFQRLRHATALPLPLGEQDHYRDESMWDEWRERPLDCFAFHCLARDRNRRFQTLDQCAAFFDLCIHEDAAALLAEPDMVSLPGGLAIGRFPVTNFQFERFCRDQRRDAPARGLRWRYATPFAPVVSVSQPEAMAYCAWLSRQETDGTLWRLPTASDWLLAANAGGQAAAPGSFPWGLALPTPASANCAGEFGGPTAVGSHPQGVAATGCLDLAGNVWEWCADRSPGRPVRWVKGGSFASPCSQVRVEAVEQRLFAGRFVDVGFRVLRERR
jgi:hypothetical protein